MSTNGTVSTAQSVGRQVRAVLAEQGRAQAELAPVLSMTTAALSRRLLGQVAFRVDEIARVAEYLQVPVARLFFVPQQHVADRSHPHPREAESADEEGHPAASRGAA
jgi:transcriptional regulator with XRE-family HTH domain